jgi:hypothetical protein
MSETLSAKGESDVRRVMRNRVASRRLGGARGKSRGNQITFLSETVLRAANNGHFIAVIK